jgi:methyl-accepting chemotaxis protein
MSEQTDGSPTPRSRTGDWGRTLREFVRYVPGGDTIPDETWRSRHRNVVVLVLAHVPLLLALGLYEGTESTVTGATIPTIPLPAVLFELGIIATFAGLATISRFPRRVRTILAVTGLLFCSGVLVHFSGGYIEAHFHFFVAMAVVAVYEDWLPFAFGIGYVVVTHGVFGMIDPSRVYNHTAAINRPWVWGVVHGVFVTGLAVALMSNWYSTEKSREKSRQRLEQAREKAQEVEDLERKQAEIERAKAEAEEMKAEAEEQKQEVERLNRQLEGTADDYSATMARAADGDLTARADPDAESEAMARVATAFNDMMDETEAAMGEIRSFAVDVAAACEEADAGTTKAETASERLRTSVGDIADGAAEQRSMLDDVSDEMTELSATVEEVAASAETVARTSHETAEVAEAGETTAETAIDDARQARAAVSTTVDHLETLEARMDRIDEIVDLIGDIAEQTNILALNASIEAARAGGGAAGADGDGFAVVASEVKNLAEETRQSATEIEDLIAETRAQTGTTAEEARTAERHMEDGVAAVEDVLDALSQVRENVADADSGVQEISEATDDQAASTEETVSMVEEVAEISRATDDEAEAVSTTATEQATSVSRVTESVASLTDQTDRLRSLLASFEVSEGAPTAPDAGAAVRDGGRPD